MTSLAITGMGPFTVLAGLVIAAAVVSLLYLSLFRRGQGAPVSAQEAPVSASEISAGVQNTARLNPFIRNA